MVPDLLALDFDGVICDGLREYFAVSWRAYGTLWPPEPGVEDAGLPPPGLAERFMALRPVIETGWEMPVLIRALLGGGGLGEPYREADLWQRWGTIARELVAQEGLDPARLSATVDGHRDRWIAEDLPGWLALHRFYPGAIPLLSTLAAPNSPTELVIITTKEERFVRQLLAREGLTLPEGAIIGKASRRPKAESLKHLLIDRPGATVWFVEDMLPTLRKVAQNPDLSQVKLFLAEWGYNTPEDRAEAAASDRLHRLTREQFSGPLAGWCS